MNNHAPDPGLLLRGRGIVKSFGTQRAGDLTHVLRGIDIDVPKGTLVSIVGPSGCGKSTLLYCLSGLDRPDEGTLSFGDSDMMKMSPGSLSKLYRAQVGFIFQSSNLVASLTALENVLLPERLRKRQLDQDQARKLLDHLGVGDRADVQVSALSNGQQQRVSLARVLVQAPAVIFADEPTGALDSDASDMALGILRNYPDQERGVVMVTHDIAAACRSDVALVMRDGVITHRFKNPEPTMLLEAMEAGR